MKYLALIENQELSIIKWFRTQREAEGYLTTWSKAHGKDKPYVRQTIAECMFTIEG